MTSPSDKPLKPATDRTRRSSTPVTALPAFLSFLTYLPPHAPVPDSDFAPRLIAPRRRR
ncbi:MAG: hypothetical protein ACK5TH_08305 [Prosthecobacter sp.]